MKKVGACSQQGFYKPVLDGEKIRIAFLFQIASQFPAWESIYYELVQDARFDVKFFLVKDNVDKSNQQVSAKEFLLSKKIKYLIFDDVIFNEFNPHIALLQTPYDYVLREHHLYARKLKSIGIRVVYIPYGIEIADTRSARHDHFRSTVVRNAWRIYTMSDEFKREYEKYCDNSIAVRGLGLPRFDMLKRRELFTLPNRVKEKLDGRKFVVWHAHFAKRIIINGEKYQITPYLEEYIRFANVLEKYEKEVFFCFIHHPLFGNMDDDLENNRKSAELLKVLDMKRNVHIDTVDDYRPILLNADAVITDRSSLAVEAGLLNAPILYLKNPDYEEALFPPLRSLFESYYQGADGNDMMLFVEKLCCGKLSAKHDAKLLNVDGKAAKRIVKDIVSSIDELPVCKKFYKFILFGTGFIYRTMVKITKWPSDVKIVALSDNNSEKWGQKFDGIEVIPPFKINEIEFDKIIICAENVFEDDIEKQLVFDLEIPKNKIEYCDYLAILKA